MRPARLFADTFFSCLIAACSVLLAACGAPAPKASAPKAAPAQASAAQEAPVFRIEPVRPVAELLPLARAATPPVESGEFHKPDLVDLASVDPRIRFDIRYATTRNFLGTPLYSQARALMERPAAEALGRVQKDLAAQGYGLLVHDAYRPWYVTKLFWDATPPDKHAFVADPAQGSRHNRGCAVDLTLYDLATGRPAEMPSLYDEMSERAYPSYAGGSDTARHLRDLLRHSMEAQGFTVYEYEWWHFDYAGWKSWPILNIRFEDIGTDGSLPRNN